MTDETLEAAVQAGQAKTDDGPWRKVPNRADRRSWGVRGRAPLGGGFRRPSGRVRATKVVTASVEPRKP